LQPSAKTDEEDNQSTLREKNCNKKTKQKRPHNKENHQGSTVKNLGIGEM
jgi:hypothetical protein